MAKRLMLATVGAALGSLLGLMVAALAGGGNTAVLIGAAMGAASPLVMGPPRH
jgi:hypothetical protein